MSYNITNNQYICAKFTDEHDVSAIESIIRDVNTKFPAENRGRVLIDTRGVEIQDSVFNINEMMKNFESRGVKKHIRIAVLRNEGSGKYHQFMKNSIEAEGYSFMLFTSFEEAVVWLRGE